MAEPMYRLDVFYGTVEIQHDQRTTPDGWQTFFSRRIERDRHGWITAISEWEEAGVRLRTD